MIGRHDRKAGGSVIYIHLIRHGKTIGNVKKQYIGSTDESLCPEGIEELVQKKARGIYPLPEEIEPMIYSSPMRRCIETAKVLYPGFHIESIDGFQETDFGPFERKNYEHTSLRLYFIICRQRYASYAYAGSQGKNL